MYTNNVVPRDRINYKINLYELTDEYLGPFTDF